jgi:deoxyribodipyrimidine photolyase-related protein
MDIPLSSKEGFIRQVLGWREFMCHIHRETDGFRLLPDGKPSIHKIPGDGGFSRWRGKKWERRESSKEIDGGAAPSFLGCRESLPPALWGEPSGLSCLDTVVADVWEEGYSHHITRLMILANIATLLDVSPRELTDWFWVAYIDAYDWVVEPNVLGMGTYAVGDLMTTKPYVSGTPYINKMSNYCRQCSFDPKKSCPISSLYWAFLERHRSSLQKNPRMKLVMASADKRSRSKKQSDQNVFQKVSQILSTGDKLTPSALP